MNQHNPPPSNPGGPGMNVPSHDQNDASNPYTAHYQQQTAPDLDAGAPQLKATDARRANRTALGMLVALAALLVFGVLWLVFAASSRNSAPSKSQKEETVNVPAAPTAPPLPPSRPAPVVVQQAQPIPLAPPLPKPTQVIRPEPHVPTLLERRIASAQGGSAASGGGALADNTGTANNNGTMQPGYGMSGMPGKDDGLGQFRLPANAAYAHAKSLPDVSSAQPLTHPDSLMLRGTYIRCVLETHIITDVPGFTSCVVTEPVYSFSGKHLLLPKGSKVLGQYDQEPNGPRVAVIWNRIVTPTGIDVNMASPGIDNLGGAGHPGHYNAHWGSRIGAALMISLLSDAFKYEAAKHGPTQTTISNGVVTQTPFESNTAQTVQNLADQAVRRAANRPATVTINQGTVVTIYVAKDVDFTGVLARN